MDKSQVNQLLWIISVLLFVILMLGLWIRGVLATLKTLRDYKQDRLRYYEAQLSATEGTIQMLHRLKAGETGEMKGQRQYYDLCETKIEALQSFPI